MSATQGHLKKTQELSGDEKTHPTISFILSTAQGHLRAKGKSNKETIKQTTKQTTKPPNKPQNDERSQASCDMRTQTSLDVSLTQTRGGQTEP